MPATHSSRDPNPSPNPSRSPSPSPCPNPNPSPDPKQVGWPETIAWFKQHWLPGFHERHDTSLIGIAKASQAKIDVQSDGTMKKQL